MTAADQRKALDRLSGSLQRLRTRPDQRAPDLPVDPAALTLPDPFQAPPDEPEPGDVPDAPGA